MTISDTGRELQPGARQPMTDGRRLWLAVALMVAWPTVAYGFGALPLLMLQPQWFPHLGVLVTNALAGTVVLAAAWGLGLIGARAGSDRGLGRAGLCMGSDPRSHLWLLPLLAIALSYAFVGKGSAPGITGTFGYLVSAVYGFVLGAGRLVVGSIWPLAFLHGLNDWMQLNSPGAAPFWYQVAVIAFEAIWATVLLTVAVRTPVFAGRVPS